MKQEECNVCFEMKEIYNNCCTFNTCNACLFLINEENCLQCQKPVVITIPEPTPKITPELITLSEPIITYKPKCEIFILFIILILFGLFISLFFMI
jgi:hypothetical protein